MISKSNVAATSVQARLALGEKALNKLQREIFDVVLGYRRNGIANMTGADIRDAWEVVHAPARLDKGTVSARVGELIKLGRLVRSLDIRECRALKPENAPRSVARPVFVPSEHGCKTL